MKRVIPKLLTWYQNSHRELPWRETHNPYYIWISEIILQQTRVEQGLSYFYRFVEKFPTISSLADATEQEVLIIWQGLGYYARARNMQFAAKQIQNEFNGEFPNQIKDILSLKGIGEYTAAAIASFAFRKPYPAIDGNVKRVSARFFGLDAPIHTSRFYNTSHSLLQEYIPQDRPDLFNQAMIELGALICLPTKPKCNECPLAELCVAFNHNKTDVLPVVELRTKAKPVFLHFFALEVNDSWVIHKRPSSGIWGGLYEFPSLESDSLELPDYQNFLSSKFGIAFISKPAKSNTILHLLSHQRIQATLWTATIDPAHFLINSSFSLVKKNDLCNFPIHKLMLKFVT